MSLKSILKCQFLLTVILFSQQSYALDSHPLDTQTYADKFTTELVTSGINVPWGMVQLPSGELLVTERSGSLYLISPKTGKKHTLSGLPAIDANGQGGLLDIALHPNYQEHPWLYFTYASKAGKPEGSHTALARAKLSSNKQALVDVEVLYKATGNTTRGQHYGSRIAFDNHGYVYFSIGDRGARDVNPQDLTRDAGKILRLHLDGQIPEDNPFVSTSKAKAAVYSYGHRNPQGLVYRFDTQQLWSHEHGPRGGDELNLIEKGGNYGWPVVSHGVNYNGTIFTQLTEKEGMTQPKLYWKPSIAPSAFIHVTSDVFPRLKGKLLLGSMKFGYIVAIEINEQQSINQYQVLKGVGRVRSLLQGNDGNIYIGLDGKGVHKIVLSKTE
ncbi:PQQ-dependent sugar dehydrogenase [Thalassotalea sp. 1_MG-2023]|uniref:PQQ-dependent sugar dehydrogenase n=1 Tax=Thalassotalea sp. 1_MG-2023 TaxID=3062680 RepID=UPI0026E431A0|nr:PQQ-dependent sugar dehydrogenase [Thalassotalea sp. 1_MG-2023]MDO6427219.1 PQQ-dependent sugar dehydrogenase [Thalassotalea sp. 1_MG-2023]